MKLTRCLCVLALGFVSACAPLDPDEDDPAEREDTIDTVSPQTAIVRCSTPGVTADQRSAIADHLRSAAPAKAQAAGPRTIRVWFHRILASNGAGGVPTRKINAQVDVLNAAYGGEWSFVLEGITATYNSRWHTLRQHSIEELEAKAYLRRGGADVLNVYLIDLSNSGLLGWAAFPWDFLQNPIDDGVVLERASLPGNGGAFGEGDTLVHEAGHWLGLLHTSEGGCAGGDEVDDTPPEKSPAYRCPTGRDTCPGGGKDPIQNYMEYTDDSCMDRFSDGQQSRMATYWSVFREGG